MVTNIITNLKGSEQGSERDAGDLSWTTWIREERKREWGQTVLLTGLALALAACGGGGSSGEGGTPTQRASLAISEGTDTGTAGDGVTNAAEVVLSVGQAPEGAVVRITRDGTQVGELLGLTSVTGGAEVRFASGIVEGQTGTFVATVLTSGTNDTALSGAYEFTVDRELPAEVTLGTTELGTVDNPMVRGDITKIEGTGEVGANVQVRLGEELLGEAKVGEDGTWVVTLDEAAQARLKAGENVLGIVQIDEAGNVSGQRTQRVHVEVEEANRVARLSLVSDTGETGDGITNGETVMLGVSAVEGKTLPAEAVVRITRDGVPVGELLETTSVTGGTEVRFASQIGVGQTGTFVATVVASRTDDTVLSRGYEFTVDRHPPEAPTITMGLGTVSVPLVREEITQVEGTGEAGAKVQVRLGEELLGEARVGEDGTWVLELDETAWARFTVGENVLGIEQEDVAGNVSEQRTQSLHVEVEEANRVARLSLVSDTGVVGDGITNGETVVLGVSAVEGKTLPAEAVVRITRDGEVIHEGLALTGNEGEFRVNVNTQVLEGQTGTFVATVVASATDDTVLSRGYEFTVDRQPPEEVTVVTELGTGEAPVARRTITQVEGTGEAGANVRVRLGEELLGEARVGEDGTWVVRLDEAARARFTVGENVLGIEQEDVAGNVSEQGAQRVYLAEDLEIEIVLASDTGIAGDDITNGETVVLGVTIREGTLPEEAMVRITRDGVPVGELLELTSVTGRAEVQFASQIGEGQTGTFVATVVASATDNTVLGQGYEFTVDRQPPEEVTVTTGLGTMEAPVARRTITQIEGTGEAGASVRVRLGEELLGEARVEEDGTWVVTLDEAARARFTVGENVLGIEQEDVAGNVSGQRTQRVYLDEDLEIEVVLVSDTGVIGDDITNGETVVLGVTAREGTLPEEAVVRITRDGEQVGELIGLMTVTRGFESSFASGIEEGQTGTFVATVLASATDDTVISEGDYTFTVDRQSPEAPTITMGLGTVGVPMVRGNITQIEGTGEAGASVRVRFEEELLGEVRVGEEGTWVVTLDEAARARFTVGENVLRIEQEDVAGNVSGQRTQSLHVEVEEANRVARLSLISDTGVIGDGITNGETVVLGVSAVEGKTLPTEAMVRIARDGVPVGDLLEMTSVTGGTEIRFASGIGEGQTGTFVATVVASRTDETVLSRGYEFTVDRQPPEAPTITMGLGTVSVPLVREEITQVEGTGEVGANVQVRFGEELLGEARVGEEGTWVVTLDEAARARFTVGENVLGIEQEDVAGNVSEQRTQSLHVEVEEANRVARLSLGNDTGVTGDGITNGETVVLGVSAVEGKTLPAEAVVRIARDGVSVGELLELTAGTQGFEISFASQIGEGQTGTFVATVVASRTDDTVLSRGYEFTVDRQPPEEVTVVTELGTVDNPMVRGDITQIEGTGETGANVQVRLGEELLGEARVGEEGTWVVTLDEAARARFTVGENVLGIEQEDVAGNVSEQRAQRVYLEVEEANRVAQLSLVSDTGVEGDGITNANTVMLGVSAVEGKALPAEAVVRITRDGAQVGGLLELTSETQGFESSFASGIGEGQTGTFVATVLASRTDDTVLSRGYEFTVDRIPPDQPTITTQNVGMEDEPVFRSELSLRFEGTGEERGILNLSSRNGSFQLISVSIEEDGRWMLELSKAVQGLLQVGENTLIFTQRDVAGNHGVSRDVKVWVKENAPVEVRVEPDTNTPGDGITSEQTVALVFSPTQGAPDLTDAVVQITQNGVVIHEGLALTNSAGEFRVSVNTQVMDGQTGTFVARLLASATDDTLLGVRYEFTVDRQPPEAPAITTENLGTVEAPVFRNEVLGIAGTGEAGVMVKVRLGDEVIAQTEVREDGTFGITWDQEARDRLSEGLNTLEIVQEDKVGHVSEGVDWVVVVKDDPQPTVSIRLSEGTDTGASNSDGITDLDNVRLAVTSLSPGGDLGEAVVQITKEGVVVATLELDGRTSVGFSSGIVQGQEGTFVARVLASATDDTPLSEAYEFTVDRQLSQAPTITMQNVGTQEDHVFRSDVRFEGTGEAGGTIHLFIVDFQRVSAQTEVKEDGTWVLKLDDAVLDGLQVRDGLQVGENTLRFIQEDVAGNGGDARSVKVWVKEDAPIEVKMEPDTGVQGDGITSEQAVALVFSPVQGAPDLTNAVVQITKDGLMIHEGLALTGNEGEFQVSVHTQVQNGQTGTFVARLLTSATDDTVLSQGYEFTVDRQNPEVPTITTQNLGTMEAPVFRSEVLGIAGTGEAGVMVKVYLGDQEIARTEVKKDGTFGVTWDQEARDRLSEGLNTLWIEQEDVAGNVSEGVNWVVFVKDDPQPTASIRVSEGTDTGASNSDGITSIAYVELGVTALGGEPDLDEAVVQITKEGVVVATLELNGATRVRFSSGIDFGQEGTFVARVLASATDDTPLSVSYEFTVDRLTPDLPSITTQNWGTQEEPVFRSDVRFEGTGEAGGTVYLSILGFQSVSVSIGENGTWALELSEAMRDGLEEGENTLYFSQQDVAGNPYPERNTGDGPTRNVKVWVKEDAPVEVKMENDTGVQGDDITSEQTVALVFTPEQGAPDLTNAVVQITRDGEIIHEGLALTGNEGEFRASVNTQVLEGQTGKLVARLLTSATDDTVLSQGYAFTVDRQPPEAPTITTENLGTVEDPVFRSEVLGIAGTGEAGARVKVRLGNEVIAQTEVREDGTFEVTLDQEARGRLSEGMNTLEIVQEDVTQNVSEGVDWVMVVKDDPPVVAIRMSDRDDIGTSGSDGITAFANVNLEVPALGGDLDRREAVVQITKEGVVVATLELIGGARVLFSSGIDFGQEGTFVARVLASVTDNTPLSAAYEFTVDRIRPDLPSITTQNLGTEDAPVFRSEVRIEGTGEAGGSVFLSIRLNEYEELLSYASIGEDGRWVLELSEAMRDRLKEGEHTLGFFQRDVAGNTGLFRDVTVWVKEYASVEVKLETDMGTKGDGITSEQAVVLVFNPAQGAPDLTNAVVRITRDGMQVGELLELTGVTGGAEARFASGIAEGQTGTFVATVLTSATDDTPLSAAYEFTVDRIDPDLPMITTENLGTVEAPVFRSEVLGIAGTGEAGVMVKVRLGDEVIAQTEVRKNGTFGITWDQEVWDRLSEGLNTLEIVQEDEAGNVSEGVDWVVAVKDDPQPTASIRLSERTDRGVLNSDGITYFLNVDLEVTSMEDGSDLNEAVVQITKEGVVVATLELDGTTRVGFASGIVAGQEGTFVARVLASATDDTPLSAAYEFTVDGIRPDLPTFTAQNVGTQEDPVFRSEVRFEGTGEAGGIIALFGSSLALVGEDGKWVLELGESDQNRLRVGENTLTFRNQDVAGNGGPLRSVKVWVKEDVSAVEVREPAEEVFVETEYAQEYAEILGVSSGEDTFYG